MPIRQHLSKSRCLWDRDATESGMCLRQEFSLNQGCHWAISDIESWTHWTRGVIESEAPLSQGYQSARVIIKWRLSFGKGHHRARVPCSQGVSFSQGRHTVRGVSKYGVSVCLRCVSTPVFHSLSMGCSNSMKARSLSSPPNSLFYFCWQNI